MKPSLTASPRSTPLPGRAHSLLRSSHLLRDAPPAVLAELSARASVRELHADDTVWREGDLAHAFHIIGRGLIRCRHHLKSGSEVSIGIFGPRESIGDTAALEERAYPADAVVVSEDAVVVAIPSRAVLELSTIEPAVATALQQALLRHGAALRAKVAIMSAGSVRARLGNLFLHLADRFGEVESGGVTVVPLSLSRSALASLVSARTETIIRALRGWEKDGLVVTTGQGFRLADLAALRACVDEG